MWTYVSYEKPDINYLMHYGKGHLDGGHSGRYPWGSGKNSNKRSYDLLAGQRWGISRYKNKDGSLTEAGKKRAAKIQREYQDLTGSSVRTSEKKETSEKKSIHDMTNEELRAYIERIDLESTYARTLKSIKEANYSYSEKFVKNFKDAAVSSISKGAAEAVGDVTKAAITKALKNSMGLSDISKKKQNK